MNFLSFRRIEKKNLKFVCDIIGSQYLYAAAARKAHVVRGQALTSESIDSHRFVPQPASIYYKK